MTVTEDEAAVPENEAIVPEVVESNGTAPVEDSYPAGDGIEYLRNGGVRFTVDGAPYTLRPPKVGMFKALNLKWTGLIGLDSVTALEQTSQWVLFLFNGDDEQKGLSDHHLPENTDDWPSWLGLVTYFPKLMAHFREVPLALGGSAGQ